jgi:hypothetical protein
MVNPTRQLVTNAGAQLRLRNSRGNHCLRNDTTPGRSQRVDLSRRRVIRTVSGPHLHGHAAASALDKIPYFGRRNHCDRLDYISFAWRVHELVEKPMLSGLARQLAVENNRRDGMKEDPSTRYCPVPNRRPKLANGRHARVCRSSFAISSQDLKMGPSKLTLW